MILFSAALPVVYGGPLLVLPLEQRQVAGRVPRSEQRSEGQREYLAESQRHLRRHRAPITAILLMDTATQATDIPPIGILLTDIRAMDTQPTHSRAMDIQAIRVVLVPSVPRPMDTTAMPGIPITQVRRAMNITVTRGTPLIQVPRAMDHLATWDTRLTPARRATNTTATRNTRLTLAHRVMDHPATRDRLLSPVPRTTDIRLTRSILPRPVPILDTLSIAIPAIMLRRTGPLARRMASTPLAEPVPPRTPVRWRRTLNG